MVHQHFVLIPELTVRENLLLSSLDNVRGFQSDDKVADALRLSEQLGWKLDPDVRVSELPVGLQQRVEVVRVLAQGAPIIIFDEPTAVLVEGEIEELFRVIRALKAEGKLVLLIAHKLKEVVQIADLIVVLRKGHLVAESRTQDTTIEEIESWMLGGEARRSANAAALFSEEVVLEVRSLKVMGDQGEMRVADVSFELRSGEILGIAGVEGNGQKELVEAIAGLRPYSGELHAKGAIGYIPGDRLREGIAPKLSIRENFLIQNPYDEALVHGPFLRPTAINAWCQDRIDKYNIVGANLDIEARTLSGGNQQKLILSRVLSTRPRIIVAVNPSRGLDFEATRFVHQELRQAANDGAGVILVSSDLDEVHALASRVVYVQSGRLASSMLGGNQ